MMRELNEMADRAQRKLDGCRVNTDAMAQDVLDLVRSVRALQTALANAQQQQIRVTAPAGAKLDEDFAETMRGIFGEGVKIHAP